MRRRQASWVGEGGATARESYGSTTRVRAAMEIREVMTESVVTAAADTAIRRIAEIMRERNVGSVVLLGAGGDAVGFITDRDLAARIGDPALAANITAQVTRAALPTFYFHDRGG